MKTEVGTEELAEMLEHVRLMVNALEQCWNCQGISECQLYYVDDGAPVWLCSQCPPKIKKARFAQQSLR